MCWGSNCSSPFIAIPTQTSFWIKLSPFTSKPIHIHLPGPHFSPFLPLNSKHQGLRDPNSEKQKHCFIQDSSKVWYSAPPLMYLVMYENSYILHSLLSRNFERSSGKLFWRIIFVCGGSKASKGLLTQEQRERLQSPRVNILAVRDLQKQCPESGLGTYCSALLTWAWDFSTF